MNKATVAKPLEVSAAIQGGLQGHVSGSVSLGDPPPPPPNPPWHRRVMDAANWVRLFEWACEKAQAISDWIASTGLFRQRLGWIRAGTNR